MTLLLRLQAQGLILQRQNKRRKKEERKKKGKKSTLQWQHCIPFLQRLTVAPAKELTRGFEAAGCFFTYEFFRREAILSLQSLFWRRKTASILFLQPLRSVLLGNIQRETRKFRGHTEWTQTVMQCSSFRDPTLLWIIPRFAEEICVCVCNQQFAATKFCSCSSRVVTATAIHRSDAARLVNFIQASSSGWILCRFWNLFCMFFCGHSVLREVSSQNIRFTFEMCHFLSHSK